MTIGKKLTIVICSLMAAGALLAGGAFWNTRGLTAALDEAVNSESRKIALSGVIAANVCDMLSLERGMALAQARQDRKQIEALNTEFQEKDESARKSIEELRPLLESDSTRQALRRMGELQGEWRRRHREFSAVVMAGGDSSAFTAQLDAFEHEVEAASETIVREQEAAMEASRQNAASMRARALVIGSMLILVLGITGVAGLWVTFGVCREMRQTAAELERGAGHVASAASQISSHSQKLSQSSSEQAASIEETSATSQEIQAQVMRNAEEARGCAGSAAQAAGQSQQACELLGRMQVSMKDISDSSKKIEKILRVIDEIAFQTNLLALNASVEAARAGEAGLGFAVVAEEVRNLAGRCAQAARETSALIDESLRVTVDGGEHLQSVSGAVESLTAQVGDLQSRMQSIVAASQEQTRGTEQIASALMQMSAVVSDSTAGAEEEAAAAEELDAQAASMKQLVDDLMQRVGR